MLALAAAAAFLASVVFGGSGVELLVGVLVAVAVAATLVLLLLPPWRDPAHGPWTGAVVLCVGAVLVVLVAVAVRSI